MNAHVMNVLMVNTHHRVGTSVIGRKQALLYDVGS